MTCRVAAVTELTADEKLFRVELPGGADLGHCPGQFVQVSILGHTEAPISVASSPTRAGWFELGVRRAGRLTAALHQLGPGDEIGIRGPFGRPFDLAAMAGQDLLLVSGGCGLAPMRSLVQYVEDRPQEFGRVTLLYGAKSPEAMLFKDDIRAWEAVGPLRLPDHRRRGGRGGVLGRQRRPGDPPDSAAARSIRRRPSR